jgi:hypothetical protein
MEKKLRGWRPIDHIKKNSYPKICGIVKLENFIELSKINLEF